MKFNGSRNIDGKRWTKLNQANSLNLSKEAAFDIYGKQRQRLWWKGDDITLDQRAKVKSHLRHYIASGIQQIKMVYWFDEQFVEGISQDQARTVYFMKWFVGAGFRQACALDDQFFSNFICFRRAKGYVEESKYSTYYILPR